MGVVKRTLCAEKHGGKHGVDNPDSHPVKEDNKEDHPEGGFGLILHIFGVYTASCRKCNGSLFLNV